MSTIRDTALNAFGRRLPRGTGAQAQVVLDALIAREQTIFGDLVEAGVELGASRDVVHDILVNAGLTAPDPVEVDCADVQDDLASLRAKVEAALTWARSKGYRG